MADFTVGMTKAATVDDSQVLAYAQAILLVATPELIVDQAANVKEEINAKSITFSKYSNMALATTPLTDGVDPDSVALADSAVPLTPVEQGDVVTTTKLASLQTGGRVDEAAVRLVGRSLGTTQDKLGMNILDAFTTTVIYPNAIASEATVTDSDILDGLFAGRLYNKLARLNVPGLFGGSYIGIAHDDVLHDLRQDTQTGGWMDVSKYAEPDSVLRNEVGMYKGIRWLRSANASIGNGSGAGAVDTYRVNVLGFNALGKAVSLPPGVRITGPFDKLARFVNIGWYGVFVYSVIDTANMVQGICASTVGANT